jgi:NAD-dependent deacetylase
MDPGDLDTLDALDVWLAAHAPGGGLQVVLTGAGISAESGIPTFRGPEGYWRVGSRNYRPMELATWEAFQRMPEEVWRWYLYRRAVCRAARPNPAHLALVEAGARLGDRFLLVTQNVDGLHRRAGSDPVRTFEIHGNIDLWRCAGECPDGARPTPITLGEQHDKDSALTAADLRALRCRCGGWRRPHVLWFDESYDEPLFRYESTMAAMERATLLLVVGTSGATSLPAHMCRRAAERDLPFVVIDPEPTPFSALAERGTRGLFLRGTAAGVVPRFLQRLAAR